MPFRNHYKTLELSPQASLSEIKKAYRELARKFHPDLNANSASSTQYFQEIQAAYEVLSNPNKRKTFDNELRHAGQYINNSKEGTISSSEQILKQSKDLKNYVQSLDARVVNNDALIDFVLGLLNQENMELLLRADSKENNFQIADNLLFACKGVVPSRLFIQLADKLLLLHPDAESPMHNRVIKEHSLRVKLERQNGLVPYVTLIVVVIVILLMWFITF